MPVTFPPRPAEIGDKPGVQRIKHKGDNRYCAGCRTKNSHDRVGSSDDYIRLADHNLPGDIGITLMLSLGGIAVDNQICSFDVTQSA